MQRLVISETQLMTQYNERRRHSSRSTLQRRQRPCVAMTTASATGGRMRCQCQVIDRLTYRATAVLPRSATTDSLAPLSTWPDLDHLPDI